MAIRIVVVVVTRGESTAEGGLGRGGKGALDLPEWGQVRRLRLRRLRLRQLRVCGG